MRQNYTYLNSGIATIYNAAKLADTNVDFSDLKGFAEMVGSNQLLTHKQISFDWLPQFRFPAQDKAFHE